MATEVAKLEAVLSASTRDFDRDIDRSGKKMSKFGSVAKAGALGAGAAIATGLGVVAKIGWDEYSQGAKVAAQTNAVLKSTAGIANVSAKEVSNLATSLMKKSGVDDEVIASGENMLLTFKGIRNEVGAGNDIFNQSTKTLLDMSTALGTDMNKSAIQLGKALNDPIKGITALTRVGVTFTEGQKATIKSLVDSGQTMQAQKIILRELNSEFGGSAEAVGKTLPGQIKIMRESFNNWAGEMVAKIIPVIQNFVGWIRQHWPEISKAIHDAWVGTIRPALAAMIELIRSVVAVVRNNWSTIGPMVITVAQIIRTQLKVVTEILRTFSALLRGDWSAAWGHLKAAAAAAVTGILLELKLKLQILKAAASALGEAALAGLRAGLAGVRALVFNYVINPFVNAINDGAGAIKKAVIGLFHKVIGWVKDALGIGSPSKVFYEMGRNSILGFIHGVGSMAGVLKNYVVHTAENAIKSIPGKVGGAIGSLGLGGSAPATNTGHLVPQVLKALIYARSHGWHGQVTSGYRTYAEQAALYQRYLRGGPLAAKPGTSSHETGQAVDVTDYGTFGRIMASAPGFERLYNRLGAADPVHYSVSGYDKGGWLPTGVSMAVNNTGRPERVLGPGEGGTMVFNFPNYVGSKQELMGLMREAARQFSLRNSRPAFGG